MPQEDVLTRAAPAFAIEDARDLLRRHWDVGTVDIAPLTSERDQNFKVAGEAGRFVLKIANEAEPPAVTRLQTDALLHVAAVNPTVAVPRVVATRSGEMEAFAGGSTLRLLTWMEGVPWHLSQRTRAQRQSIAAGHAHLVQALSGFQSSTEPPFLQWDVQHAARLRDHVNAVPDDLRASVDAGLALFDEHVAPRLGAMARQFVHNDIQPHNVVVDAADTDRLSGILDFGDMVETPVACDLAVACSYNILPGEHPLQTAGEYAAAFHKIRPLSDVDLAALPALIMARNITTIVITSRRILTHPANADYILRNQPAARAGLAQLLGVPYREAVDYLRMLCP